MKRATVDVEQGTELKTGDTLPVFEAQLLVDGEPYDLTGKTPELHMNQEGTDLSSKKIAGAAMTVVDAKNGQVKYQWAATDTDTEGDFNAEIIAVDDSNGAERTFPTRGFIDIRIFEDLQ